MNRMQAWSGMFAASMYDGVVSPDYSVFEASDELEVEFFAKLFRTPDLVSQFAELSKGIGSGFNRLYTVDFGQVKVPVPTLKEQQTIVRFLDYIDGIVRRYTILKQKLITLLEEQKQSIIDQAITGKTDVRTGRPHRAYKKPDVDWLDDIPMHWDVVRLKFAAETIVDCLHETPEYSETGMFPAIRTADISPGMVDFESARRIEEQEYTRWTERLEPMQNDILYSREGERYGIAACVPEGVRLCISQRMMVFRIRAEHNPVFVMWALNSRQVYAQACQDLMGATAPHVNVATIRNYCFGVPGRDEQDAVVELIESSTRGYSAAIANANGCISRAREFQERLNADVIIGRLDVQDAALWIGHVFDEGHEPTFSEHGSELDLGDRGPVFEPVGE